MPLARIDLIKGKPSDYRRTIGDVVYKAMVDILKAPENDRFQVIAEHDAEDFVFGGFKCGTYGLCCRLKSR
jgi:4-oxalocrotonate tautomerase